MRTGGGVDEPRAQLPVPADELDLGTTVAAVPLLVHEQVAVLVAQAQRAVRVQQRPPKNRTKLFRILAREFDC